jgi:hypothetical protein
VPARVRDVTIDYTALSFAAPDRVRFRYMLEGQDPGWREGRKSDGVERKERGNRGRFAHPRQHRLHGYGDGVVAVTHFCRKRQGLIQENQL